MRKPAALRRTRRALVVGITGHRPNRIPAAELPRIKAQLAGVMTSFMGRYPGRRRVLVSGLAEGADRLGAFTALGLGWGLHAILPFHRDRFEQDFPDPYALGEFRVLISSAAKVTEPGPRWHLTRSVENGYAAMGRAMLSRCEELIAIWDGEGARGEGGTIEVVEAARARGMPVVWVHAAKAVQPRNLTKS